MDTGPLNYKEKLFILFNIPTFISVCLHNAFIFLLKTYLVKKIGNQLLSIFGYSPLF